MNDAPAGADDLRAVGIVIGEHGLQGTLKVLPLSDFPERYDALRRVIFACANGETAEYHVRRVRWSGANLLMSVQEITDRTQAQALRGAEICVPAAESWTLPDNVYYASDLIGFRGITEDGTEIGELTAVMSGSQDILVFDRGGRELLVPFVDEWTGHVDTEARTIELRNWRKLAEPEEIPPGHESDDH